MTAPGASEKSLQPPKKPAAAEDGRDAHRGARKLLEWAIDMAISHFLFAAS
jgi:hypothetical protein